MLIRLKFSQALSFGGAFLVFMFFLSCPAQAQDSEDFVQSHHDIWQSEPGRGFQAGAQSISVTAGVHAGVKTLGSLEAHHMAMLGISYGYMLSDVVGEGHWWQGNFELRAELMYGAQFDPDGDWLVSVTPHIRYNFITGTPFVPFIGGGAGLTATGIGPPDLSGVFEFNEQATIGTHWFLNDHLSLTLEARFIHVSCAGISRPNRGINGVVALVGVSHYF